MILEFQTLKEDESIIFYFQVQGHNVYDVRIEIDYSGNIIQIKGTNPHCTCMWGTWEESRTIKTNKYCRHVLECLSLLKNLGYNIKNGN